MPTPTYIGIIAAKYIHQEVEEPICHEWRTIKKLKTLSTHNKFKYSQYQNTIIIIVISFFPTIKNANNLNNVDGKILVFCS